MTNELFGSIQCGSESGVDLILNCISFLAKTKFGFKQYTNLVKQFFLVQCNVRFQTNYLTERKFVACGLKISWF